MARYRLSYSREVEADSLERAREIAESLADSREIEITEIKGDNSDPFDAPLGRHVLVWLSNGRAIKAKVTGWFHGEHPYSDAQNVKFGDDEYAIIASEVDDTPERPKEEGFYADIGDWNAGKHIKLEAKTLEAAIEEASSRLGEVEGFGGDEPMVVQVFYNGHIVWDYINQQIGTCPTRPKEKK